MKTAKKKRALRSFCAVLSAVFFFLFTLSVFLYGFYSRYSDFFEHPEKPHNAALLDGLLSDYDTALSEMLQTYYSANGTKYTYCPNELLPQNTNLRVFVTDKETHTRLLHTEKSQMMPDREDVLLHTTHDSTGKKYEKLKITYTDANGNTVEKSPVIDYYLLTSMTVRDRFFTARSWLRTGRTLLPYFWSSGTIFLALTVLFCILFLRSAWREGTIASGRRLFREIPPDLLLVCLLPSILLCASQLNAINVRILLRQALTQIPERLLVPSAYSTCLFFLLLWIIASILFSIRRYGVHGLLSYSRFENAPFTRRTLPAFALLQIIKTCVFLLYAQKYPQTVVVLFLVVEKAVILPVLYRCLREIRTVSENTEAIALGDLSHPVGTTQMYQTIQNHAKDIRRIAQRISISADEYIRSGQFKAELITNLSHDIKTPLTSIINYAALLQNEKLSEQDKQRYTAVLHRHAQRLSRLVEDLTQVSDTQSGKLEAVCERVDLSSLVVQAAIGFRERLQKQRITTHFSVPATPVYVRADNRLLWRVADNLMNNICKYAMPGTGVYISVTVQDGTACAIFENVPSAPLDKTEDALMERFVRDDSSRHTEGTGLGLSIARSLMELQGGTLNLHTEPSRFIAEITLPED